MNIDDKNEGKNYPELDNSKDSQYFYLGYYLPDQMRFMIF